MKVRLLVMNGQRITQREDGGKWLNDDVDKAIGLKPGIYNIYLATPAEKRKTYEGLIVYADDDLVYQQIGKGFVTHARKHLDKMPIVGGTYQIEHGAGKAIVTAMSPKRLARKI